MSSTENILSIKILDKHYKVKCQPEQVDELQKAANHLNEQMKKLRLSSNDTSPDGIAIVAALNICHELQVLKNEKNQWIKNLSQRVQLLQNKVAKAVATTEETAV
jgi:cell division protein ZapA